MRSAFCALRIVRGIKKAGDKEVESIEVETAEYFRYKYWVMVRISRPERSRCEAKPGIRKPVWL
jgi:hypothetical protein